MNFARTFALTAAVAVAGCAVNPYTADTRPAAGQWPAAAPQGPPARGSLEYGVAYADATYDAYRAKLSEEFTRQQQLSNGLLTLGAVTVGAAIGKAHRDAVIAAALGGALVYQLGTWNSNDGRLGVYLEGMKAMACVKSAVAPLRLGTASVARIRTAEGEVRTALDSAASALGELTRWVNVAAASQAPNSETVQAARTEITDAAAQFTQAGELLKLANGITQKADGAGAAMEPRVDEIRRLVDEALKGSLANLSALPAQIGGIVQYANVFAPGVNLDTVFQDRIAALRPPAGQGATSQGTGKPGDPGKSAAAPLEPRAELAQALGNLRAARIRLAARMAMLSGATERSTSQVQADLAGCGVDASKVAHAIRLDRATVVLKAGQPSTSLVGVTGGTPPLSANLQDLPAKGVNVTVPAGGAGIVVVGDATTVAGSSYLVKVEDGAKASALLTVKVDPADAASGTGTRQCTGPLLDNRALVCLLQNVVGTKPTGEMDAATCTGLVDKVSPDGVLDDKARARILELKKLPAQTTDDDIRAKALSSTEQQACKVPAPTSQSRRKPPAREPVQGARNDVERRLGPAEVRVMSGKLGMKVPVETFTDDFRRAVANYRAAHGLGAGSEVTEDLARQLLK